MRIQQYVCDRCNQPCDENGEVHLRKGRRMDAPWSIEVEFYIADLCPKCMRQFLHYILGKQHEIRYPGVHLEDFIEIGKKA